MVVITHRLCDATLGVRGSVALGRSVALQPAQCKVLRLRCFASCFLGVNLNLNLNLRSGMVEGGAGLYCILYCGIRQCWLSFYFSGWIIVQDSACCGRTLILVQLVAWLTVHGERVITSNFPG